jgi:hypothetical protein
MTDVNKLIENRAARYKDPKQRWQFSEQVRNPPTFIQNGRTYRRLGSSIYYPFWRAYDRTGYRAVPTSHASVAMAAGKFRRELEERGLLPVIDAIPPDARVCGVLS